MKITVEGIEFGFDAHGLNHSKTQYSQFVEVEDKLEQTDEGSCGGAHGTEQGFYEFRVNDDYVIRRVLPGALQNGYLEAIAFPRAEQERQAADDEAWESVYEQRERDYQAQLSQ